MTIRVRTISAILCVLLLAGTSAVGGPVRIPDVIQVTGTGTDYSLPKLRLRHDFQSGGEPLVGVNGLAQEPAGEKQTARNGSAGSTLTTAGQTTHDSTDSLLSNIAGDLTQSTVSVISQGNVDGTICDCGEITMPGGGFPKWTLLFLGAIPLSFIHGTEETLPPTSNPTSNPTPAPISTPTPTVPVIPQVPEPTSLLLFGFGLVALASFRRRASAKRKGI